MDFELAILVKKFVEFVFAYFNIEQNIFKEGRPPFKLINVISLLIFGNVNGITSTEVIASNSKHHELYQLFQIILLLQAELLENIAANIKNYLKRI